jgi:hypothetical protein
MFASNVPTRWSFSRSMFRYRKPAMAEARGGVEAPLHAAEEIVRKVRLAVGDPEARHVATEPERHRVRDVPGDATTDHRIDHAAAIRDLPVREPERPFNPHEPATGQMGARLPANPRERFSSSVHPTHASFHMA